MIATSRLSEGMLFAPLTLDRTPVEDSARRSV
jgi:hypothetical protein